MSLLTLEIEKSLRSQSSPLVLPTVRKLIKSSFAQKKKKMITDFLNHPITQEIKAGVQADNISGTLGGVTNLFSFIGFEQGDDPIAPILDLLNGTTISIGQRSTKGATFSVQLPEAEDIFKVTPLPYMTGRSWAQSMETGLSGLGYYLKKKSDASRSGFGIQSKKRVRKARFQNTKYISHFLKTYKKEFQNLKI
jgi:hypothetical protein